MDDDLVKQLWNCAKRNIVGFIYGAIGSQPEDYLVGKAAKAIEAKNARIAELEGTLEKLQKAIKPFANAVFNDNGDCTVTPCHNYDSYIAAYFTERKTRIVLAKEPQP